MHNLSGTAGYNSLSYCSSQRFYSIFGASFLNAPYMEEFYGKSDDGTGLEN